MLQSREIPDRDTGRGWQMYHDIDYGLGKERVAQIRTEVERNRLEARLAEATRSSEESVPRKGMVARGAALLTVLFR